MKVALLVFAFLFGSIATGLAETFVVFEENGKVGIKNQQGQVVVPASFEALGWSDGSFSVVGEVTGYRLNQGWGILNLKKEFVTKAVYETLVYASGEFIVARKKINPVQTKTGCLNLQGEIKIPFQYDGISIHGLRAIVFNMQQANYFYGLLDLQNRVLLPVQYKNIYPLGTLRFAVENFHNKTALYRDDGQPVTDFTIDSVSQFHKSRAILYQDYKQGLIDREGQILLKPEYHSIKILDEEKISTLMPQEWLLLNERNEIQLSVFANELIATPDAIIYSNSNKYGLLTKTLGVLLPAQYDHLEYIGDNRYVATKKEKTGVIKADNSVLIPLLYDSLITEGNALRGFKKTTGWLLLDYANQPVTHKHYEWIGEQIQHFYPVKKNGYWGVLKNNGEEIVHCVFDTLMEITSDRIVVKFRNQFGIIDAHENWLVAPQAFPIKLVSDSCYLQTQSQHVFLKKIPDETLYFTDNPMEFKKDYWIETLPDGTIKKLDYNARVLERIDPPILDKLEETFTESEGMRGIRRDGKFGFIDSRGRLRIANRYDGIGNFHDGLAAIKLRGKWGFLNVHDQIVINPNFESVNEFANGFCIVKRNGVVGVIDQTGKIVLAIQYDSIHRQVNKKLRLFKSGLIGLAEPNGSILIEPRFDYLQELENGFVITGLAGKYGVISITGLSVIPPVYDALSFDVKRNQYLALKKSVWKELSIK